MIFSLLRTLIILVGTVVCVVLGYALADKYPDWIKSFVALENPEMVFAVLLGFIGFLICSMCGRELQDWVEKQLDISNSKDLAWNSMGFVLGILTANLLLIPFYLMVFNGSINLNSTDKYVNEIIPLFIISLPLFFNLFFAYIGLKITVRYRRFQDKIHIGGINVKTKILDTSAAIDGRFADIFRLGFIEGNLLIPNFIINELQLMASSIDNAKAERGNRALETVNRLCKDFPDNVAIATRDYPEIPEIEKRLLKFADETEGIILTQDSNVKKIAELKKISSLNINDLANALKAVFITGDNIEIKVIRHGKDIKQGVGFLNDGTMVVIEDGGEQIGKTVKARVNNILQTGAGRMIFCRIGDVVEKIEE